jgi:adenosine kinase
MQNNNIYIKKTQAKTLICGSMAYDSIFNYAGEFADANLGAHTGTLNASFLAQSMYRHFGGCAGNIAYGLKLLGSEPYIVATMGADATDYLQYLAHLNIHTQFIKVLDDHFTVQLIIINDAKQNQINTFYPGAMAYSHLNSIKDIPDLAAYTYAIVAPDGKQGMLAHLHDLYQNNVACIFDPGQAMPLFDAQELCQAIEYSQYVIVNAYECDMLKQKTQKQIIDFLPKLTAFIVTLAEEGACLYTNEHPNGQIIAGVAAANIVDPTGCGDAFRAGFIHGLEHGLSMQEAIMIGNKMGANKIAYAGGQGYNLSSVFNDLNA